MFKGSKPIKLKGKMLKKDLKSNSFNWKMEKKILLLPFKRDKKILLIFMNICI